MGAKLACCVPKRDVDPTASPSRKDDKRESSVELTDMLEDRPRSESGHSTLSDNRLEINMDPIINPPDAIICQHDEEEPATIFCKDCGKNYCDECNTVIHMAKKKRDHVTEAIPPPVPKVFTPRHTPIEQIPVPCYDAVYQFFKGPVFEPLLSTVLGHLNDVSNRQVWTEVKRLKSGDACVFHRNLPGNAIGLFQSRFVFRGLAVNNLYDLLFNLDIKRRWDKNVDVYKRVTVLNNNHAPYVCHDVMYSSVAGMLGISGREFVDERMCFLDTKESFFVYLTKSIEHEEYPLNEIGRPKNSNFIRAETILLGIIAFADPRDPSGKTLIGASVGCADIKGKIPHVIVKAKSKTAPFDWYANINAAFHKLKSGKLIVKTVSLSSVINNK